MDLEAAVTALAPRVLAYALARTGSLADAEDVAQEALAGLVRRWRRAGPPDSAEAFVFGIAKRRAGRATARRALAAPLDAVRSAIGLAPSAEHALVARGEVAVVLAAIRTLRRADREALLLRAAGELEFHAIAALLHTTEAAVKMRISRARRRLAALVLEQSHDR